MDVFLTGFPKKLLVAISVVVIIAMCLVPADARPPKHTRRAENIVQTKEIHRTVAHRRRHERANWNRPGSLTLPTKELMTEPKKERAKFYNKEMKNIMKKVRNTWRFFNREQQLNKLEGKQASPPWLPSVNFVEIHSQNFSSNRFRKNGTSIAERKYNYLIPKLFKSLMEYREIFQRLLNAELDFADDPFQSYKDKRHRIINNTLKNLNSTIAEVRESMASFNLSTQISNKKKLDLSALETKFIASQCLTNDYLAFRGYGNLLSNWYSELSCAKKAKTNRRLCRKYEEKFVEKNRNRNKGSS